MECTNPNGCTLESDELVTRIAEWREVSAQALSRKVEPARITSVYPPDPQLLKRLEDLIAAEAECCAFLEFTIQAGTDQTIVQLSFPEEARPLIEAVMASREKESAA